MAVAVSASISTPVRPRHSAVTAQVMRCIPILNFVGLAHLCWTEIGHSIAPETAMRRGEIRTLKWKNVNIARRTAFCRLQRMDAHGQYPSARGL